MKNTIFSWLAACTLALAGCGDPDPAVLADQALSAAAQGEWAQCVKLCDKVLKKHPSAADILTLKAIALDASGDKTAAATAVRIAAENSPNYFPARYLQGYMLLESPGGERRAMEELTDALRIDAASAGTLLLLSEAAGRINDENTDLYIAMLPSEYLRGAAVQSRLGVFCAVQGRLAEAGKAFAAAYSEAPQDPRTVLNLARYYDYYAHDPASAVPRYQEYLKVAADDPELTGTRTLVEGRINALKR